MGSHNKHPCRTPLIGNMRQRLQEWPQKTAFLLFASPAPRRNSTMASLGHVALHNGQLMSSPTETRWSAQCFMHWECIVRRQPLLQKVSNRIAALRSRLPSSLAGPSGRRKSQQIGQVSSSAKGKRSISSRAPEHPAAESFCLLRCCRFASNAARRSACFASRSRFSTSRCLVARTSLISPSVSDDCQHNGLSGGTFKTLRSTNAVCTQCSSPQRPQLQEC
mmetsp:Transcript_8912/g.24352  ORF Transcript_8912/g.24352 Transcript_8912/m.24352 type:complete len:221 (-) Transcript_8912:93-755(-)